MSRPKVEWSGGEQKQEFLQKLEKLLFSSERNVLERDLLWLKHNMTSFSDFVKSMSQLNIIPDQRSERDMVQDWIFYFGNMEFDPLFSPYNFPKGELEDEKGCKVVRNDNRMIGFSVIKKLEEDGHEFPGLEMIELLLSKENYDGLLHKWVFLGAQFEQSGNTYVPVVHYKYGGVKKVKVVNLNDEFDTDCEFVVRA